MCGLCGSFTEQGMVLSKRNRVQRARVIEGLLIANQVRGTDSTGIAMIDYDGHYDILKKAVEPWKFVNQKETQAMLRTDSPLIIGHTRMTSMGNDVVDANAHPFAEGNIVGAHNGVINNYIELDRTVRVDSQAVLRELDQHPQGYDYAFSRVSGSCALTWWDMRQPDALFLVAHMNPLAVAIVPRIKTLFWSSVSDHLESIMRASYGNDVDYVEIKQNTIYRVSADDVYSWQEGAVTFGSNAPFRQFSGSTYYDSDDDNAWRYVDQYGGAHALPKGSVESTDDDEARYEKYWMDMIAREGGIVGKKNDDDEGADGRFGIDDLDNSLVCGYCDNPLGMGGVWDSGLEMLLCKPCQNWWDNFGYAKQLEAILENEAAASPSDEQPTYPLAVV